MKWQQGSERLTRVNELGLLEILPYGSLNKSCRGSGCRVIVCVELIDFR